jgi:hypothetical protein
MSVRSGSGRLIRSLPPARPALPAARHTGQQTLLLAGTCEICQQPGEVEYHETMARWSMIIIMSRPLAKRNQSHQPRTA